MKGKESYSESQIIDGTTKAALIAKDETAWAKYYPQFTRQARHFARRHPTLTPEDLEDVAQEAAFYAFRGLLEMGADAQLTQGWGMRITHNALISELRKHSRRPTSVSHSNRFRWKKS